MQTLFRRRMLSKKIKLIGIKQELAKCTIATITAITTIAMSSARVDISVTIMKLIGHAKKT